MRIEEKIKGLRFLASVRRDFAKNDKTKSQEFRDDCIKEAENQEQIADWLEELVELRKPKYIKCDNADELVNLDSIMKKNGYETEFCYELNGQEGMWLEVRENV